MPSIATKAVEAVICEKFPRSLRRFAVCASLFGAQKLLSIADYIPTTYYFIAHSSQDPPECNVKTQRIFSAASSLAACVFGF
uniref:Uncharacterized protein n=1 Tax=Panagrellus redivivus TaxID=6233 RepID=A0A7E4UWM3_PANRE